MDREQITGLLAKFEAAKIEYEGVECWSARDLQPILGYKTWENFSVAIKRAREACETAEIAVSDHFREVTKMILIGKGGERPVADVLLTRYAAYLICQNGDPQKPEIAFAQTYFAVQTRKQELIEQRLLDVDRVNAREKLMKSEKMLSGVLYERGIDERGFAFIRNAGDEALFGGLGTQQMKQKLGVPATRPLADFLPTLTVKAKDFAAELTSHNVQEKDLTGEKSIRGEHIDNNKAVRKILLDRGVRPELLPPAEDVQKTKRRLESEEKKIRKGLPKKK